MPRGTSQTEDQSARAKARDLQTESQRLKGHIAVVTGADSGIGQAIAIAFAKEGADVAFNIHRDTQGADETRQQVEGAGRRAAVFKMDQKDSAQVGRFFEQVRDELGTPTILVNNAGIGGTMKPVHELSDEDWDNAIRTDLHGPFYCCREFLKPLLEEGKRGVIVNITSVHESIAMPSAAPYDAAKGGLRNLTRTLALELADKGVRVVNLAPGMVLTPMNQDAIDDPDVLRKRSENIPMKRPAEPEEIARCAVFLASEEASYVHGATLFVDGGLTQNMGQGA